jgi:hypothetical protein
MNKFEKLRKELSDIHQSFLENPTLESVKEEIACYESFIKNFFTKEGHGLEVKFIFNDKRDNSEVRLESTDLSKVQEVYSEYIGGMMNFINDIVSANVISESEEVSSLQEKFNRAKENDSQFIESLCTKYVEKGDYLLTEASGNIAFLIDFIPEMNILLNYCESTASKVAGREDQLSKDSLSMVYESVSHYCNYVINESINVYESIDNILNGKPDEGPKEVFKLF